MARFFIPLVVFSSSLAPAFAAMPAAGIPMEPASSDAEMNAETPPTIDPGSNRAERPKGARKSASLSTEPIEAIVERRGSILSDSELAEAGDFGVALRLSMIKDGFGTQLKLLQYPRSWLAVTETYRYFKNDETDRLYHQRQGFLIGMDMHPWRKSFLSPFLNTQLGWERFYREERVTIDTSLVEASAGLELRLGRLASVVGQWTETFYPGLDEAIFLPNKAGDDPKRHASLEVMLNLKWEGQF